MKTAEVKAVFDVLRPELTAIVREAGEPADDSFLEGDYPVATQQEFLEGVLRDFGFEDDTYRLDPTVHPFATTVLAHGHPDDDAVQADEPAGALGGDARGRARPHVPRHRALALALAAVRERLARAGRVAEPHLGEPRRPLAAVLARPAPGAAAVLPATRVGRPRDVVSRHQPRRAGADPRRLGRGHVLPAHHPPLRAGAGARLRLARPRRPARGLEREDEGSARRRRARRRARRPPGRALDAGLLRLLPDLRPRQRALGADLARGRGGAGRPGRAARGGRVRAAVRVAAPPDLPARAQVHAGRDARARDRRRRRSTRSRTSRTCARRSPGSSPRRLQACVGVSWRSSAPVRLPLLPTRPCPGPPSTGSTRCKARSSTSSTPCLPTARTGDWTRRAPWRARSARSRPGSLRRRAGRTCASTPIRAPSTSASSGWPRPTPPSPPGAHSYAKRSSRSFAAPGSTAATGSMPSTTTARARSRAAAPSGRRS